MSELNDLFYKNPYLKKFSSVVVDCREGKGNWLVALQESAFYPEGGGQLADHGKIAGVSVLDCRRIDGVVWHTCDKPLTVGEAVDCEIDWERRYNHMQNHSGEHLLTGLIHQKFGYDNVGFHMDENLITCDFNGPITEEELVELEKKANEAIYSNVAIRDFIPTQEELEVLDYRSKKKLSGDVRIVEVVGIDRCACCGTHVKSAGEIGIIKCLTLSKHRGGTRITFVCGQMALRDYAWRCRETQAVSELFSAKPDEIALAAKRVLSEIEVRDEKIKALNRRYFELIAQTLPQNDELLIVLDNTLSAGDLKQFALVMSEKNTSAVIVLLSAAPESHDDNYNYVIYSKTADLRSASRTLNAALNGRGGGKDFIQGSYKASESMIRENLAAVFEKQS